MATAAQPRSRAASAQNGIAHTANGYDEAGYLPVTARPRGLVANISMALFQPRQFFRTLPRGKQWLIAAALILVLVGMNAVQGAETAGAVPTDPMGGVPPVIDPVTGMPMDTSGPMGGPVGVPIDGPMGGPSLPSSDSVGSANRVMMIAVLAAGGVVFGWLIQSVILAEVSLLRGRMPSFSRNLQIAVWASLPLGLLALVQILYRGAGGTGGQMGLVLLMEQLPTVSEWPVAAQAVLRTTLESLTLFFVWGIILLYMGARHALNGWRLAALLAVVMWVIVSAALPVVGNALSGKPLLPSPEAVENGVITPQDGAPVDLGEAPMPGNDGSGIAPVMPAPMGAAPAPMIGR